MSISINVSDTTKGPRTAISGAPLVELEQGVKEAIEAYGAKLAGWGSTKKIKKDGTVIGTYSPSEIGEGYVAVTSKDDGLHAAVTEHYQSQTGE